MAKSTLDRPGPIQTSGETNNLGQDSGGSGSGFSMGLGVGMFVGAVVCGLLTSRGGTDFMGFLEEKTAELKDKAKEMLEGSEIKEKVREVLHSKAMEAVSSVKDKALEKVGAVVESVTEGVGGLTSGSESDSNQDDQGDSQSERQAGKQGQSNKPGGNGKGK